jgi:hypothetical protein
MSKMSNILGPPVSYIDILDDQIMENQKKDEELLKAGKSKFGSPLRPSSAGECERALAFKLQEFIGTAYYEKELMTPATVRLLGLGNSVEFSIIRFLKQCELFQVKYEQQTLGFFNIESENPKIAKFLEGSNDLCIVSEQHGWKAVVDVKSKGDKFSSTHSSKWAEEDDKFMNMKTMQNIGKSAYWVEDLEAFLEELNDPFFAANFLQVNLYANSQFMKERGINHGVILQYQKNTSVLREVRFKPSEKLYKDIEIKFKAAAAAATANDPMLAKETFLPGSIKCAFCAYVKPCRGNFDTKKAFFNTLKDKYFPKNFNKVEDEQLKAYLLEFDAIYGAEKQKSELEQKIAKRMLDSKTYKVKLDNGHVYEVKTFKTTTSVKRGKV